MTAQPVFDAIIDSARNVVRARFAGTLTAAEIQPAAAQVESLLVNVRPGFTVLSDFSQVASMDIDCAPHLARIMELTRAHGIGLIVRVLPEPKSDIGINILAVVHYRGEVKTVTVGTLDEAERILR